MPSRNPSPKLRVSRNFRLDLRVKEERETSVDPVVV